MIIQEQIGNLTLTVGLPSKNHLQITPNNENEKMEIHLANWELFKKKVDIMFKAAADLQK